MAVQLPSSSSSFTSTFTYDVFLSFRGEDTRYGFTGYLYKALRDAGIHTFIDDHELLKGDQITPTLEKAIEKSRIFIIILSQNYASSSFCLNELAYILKFVKEKDRLVFPVFHKVDPSDIRHQRGSFREALADHEKMFNVDEKGSNHNMKKLEEWKMALCEVANLSGHHFKYGDGYEYKFIKKIVQLNILMMPELASIKASRWDGLVLPKEDGDAEKELHEAGNTVFYLPESDIPEWFEWQNWGPRLWIQSDFHEAINLITNGCDTSHHIIQDIKNWQQRPWTIKFSHCFGDDVNLVVRSLANNGHKISDDTVFLASPPAYVSHLLLVDSVGIVLPTYKEKESPNKQVLEVNQSLLDGEHGVELLQGMKSYFRKLFWQLKLDTNVKMCTEVL
ncbi:hypothetical protein VNO78_21153 [Psophocarpus tetragonolobus]|uniref:TIR domain-containing protein n=1 Tax=Psophocarpus tetragonolobus TaxID=3891 RepID=A0AAN9XI48_PSOTE